MTICNMTIEGGGRAGHDRARRDHLRVRRGPPGAPGATSTPPSTRWRALPTDDGASFDTRGRRSTPPRSRRWSPGARPRAWSSTSPTRCPSPRRPRRRRERALAYMDLEPGTPIQEITLDRVFIGSCTNSRIDDLRAAADDGRGPQGRRRRRRDGRARAPQQVKAQAEAEGLDEVFRAAGFDWRDAGCSMCLGMNPDILQPGRALRLDLEPQLRGPPGPRRAHPPGQPADGRRGRDRGPLRRHPGLELGAMEPIDDHRGRRRRCSTATTSTPTRSSPSSSSSGSSAPASASSCSTTGPRSPAGSCSSRTRSSSPAATSAAAPPASTRRGRSRTTASRRSSRRRFADIFYSNCTKIGLLPVVLDEERLPRRSPRPARPDRPRRPGGQLRRAASSRFEIDEEIKHRLLNGLDDIAMTLQQADDDRRLRGATRERAGPVTTAL